MGNAWHSRENRWVGEWLEEQRSLSVRASPVVTEGDVREPHVCRRSRVSVWEVATRMRTVFW